MPSSAESAIGALLPSTKRFSNRITCDPAARCSLRWQKNSCRRERLAFRDRLRRDVSTREAYPELKLRLMVPFRDGREAYTEGKMALIESILDTFW